MFPSSFRIIDGPKVENHELLAKYYWALKVNDFRDITFSNKEIDTAMIKSAAWRGTHTAGDCEGANSTQCMCTKAGISTELSKCIT